MQIGIDVIKVLKRESFVQMRQIFQVNSRGLLHICYQDQKNKLKVYLVTKESDNRDRCRIFYIEMQRNVFCLITADIHDIDLNQITNPAIYIDIASIAGTPIKKEDDAIELLIYNLEEVFKSEDMHPSVMTVEKKIRAALHHP